MIPILKIVNCTGYSLALNVSIIYYLFSLFVGGFNRVEFFFFYIIHCLRSAHSLFYSNQTVFAFGWAV